LCQCDAGYTGKSCATATKTLPRFLKEDFESSLSSKKWAWVGGGTVGNTCGTVSSGKSMVFKIGRSRILETVDLDLRHATTVRFTMKVGSTVFNCSPPSDNTKNVFLQYSINGGISWNVVLTIQYNDSYWFYDSSIPHDMRTAPIRIRFYQPIASGTDMDVWAIDDVTIKSVDSSLPCASSPCQNQGTCTNTLDGTYSCQCPALFTGKDCQSVSYCFSSPCQNGGTCMNYFDTFLCYCLQGYTGTTCESDIDECSSKPCQVGGACTDRVNGYDCLCPQGYTGTTCESDIDA
jgi:hypothetical protein